MKGMTEMDDLPRAVAMAFAPMHKRALGIAVGMTVGVLLSAITIFHVLVPSTAIELNVELLSQYFYGYEVSWRGALVGFFWGFVSGFVSGWFVAFTRNMVTAVWVFALKTRAELSQTSGFLDHI
jgi:hypothetical protein